MRQNAEPILALAEFKRLISVIKNQELMPDPFEKVGGSALMERKGGTNLARWRLR